MASQSTTAAHALTLNSGTGTSSKMMGWDVKPSQSTQLKQFQSDQYKSGQLKQKGSDKAFHFTSPAPNN